MGKKLYTVCETINLEVGEILRTKTKHDLEDIFFILSERIQLDVHRFGATYTCIMYFLILYNVYSSKELCLEIKITTVFHSEFTPLVLMIHAYQLFKHLNGYDFGLFRLSSTSNSKCPKFRIFNFVYFKQKYLKNIL